MKPTHRVGRVAEKVVGVREAAAMAVATVAEEKEAATGEVVRVEETVAAE